jgi:hypothetical protein
MGVLGSNSPQASSSKQAICDEHLVNFKVQGLVGLT